MKELLCMAGIVAAICFLFHYTIKEIARQDRDQKLNLKNRNR